MPSRDLAEIALMASDVKTSAADYVKQGGSDGKG
jgi:hypothetical protein